MNLLRGILFDNLGLKLAALLLALLIYLNVYLDRPAVMTVSFPVEVQDLGDSLSLSGPVPSTVQAILRGTGKQLLKLRVTEPACRLPLEGVGAGPYRHTLRDEDLPLSGYELAVENLLGPTSIAFDIERKVRRLLPAAVRVEGTPAPGLTWTGPALLEPESVLVTGPRSAVVRLDSVVLQAARVTGRRATVRVAVAAESLPDWCSMEPQQVMVTVPLVRR